MKIQNFVIIWSINSVNVIKNVKFKLTGNLIFKIIYVQIAKKFNAVLRPKNQVFLFKHYKLGFSRFFPLWKLWQTEIFSEMSSSKKLFWKIQKIHKKNLWVILFSKLTFLNKEHFAQRFASEFWKNVFTELF